MEPSRKTKILYGLVLPIILPLVTSGIMLAAFLFGGFWVFVGVGIALTGAAIVWTRNRDRKHREKQLADPQL